MNRWHVFEYIKTVYIRTGLQPSRSDIQLEFDGMSESEVDEGIEEFQALIGKDVAS